MTDNSNDLYDQFKKKLGDRFEEDSKFLRSFKIYGHRIDFRNPVSLPDDVFKPNEQGYEYPDSLIAKREKWTGLRVQVVEGPIAYNDEVKHSGDGDTYDYVRYIYQIDRTNMREKKNDKIIFGNEHLVVLMKNPSFGIDTKIDNTLESLIINVPKKYGIIDCVNLTPVVNGGVEKLTESDNLLRINDFKDTNKTIISTLLELCDSDVLIATGGFYSTSWNFVVKKYKPKENVDQKYKILMKKKLNNKLVSSYLEIVKQFDFERVYVLNSVDKDAGSTGCHPRPQKKSDVIEYKKDGNLQEHIPFIDRSNDTKDSKNPGFFHMTKFTSVYSDDKLAELELNK